MQQTIIKKDIILSQLIKSEPDIIAFLKEGDLIEAEFIARNAKAVYFDLGKFGTGIIYGAELANSKDILKNIIKGGKVSAKIISLDNDNGFIELSLVGAHKQKGWQELKAVMENEEILNVKIIGANTGGLITEINEIKAFLPVSQLSNKNYPRIDSIKTEAIETTERNEILKELKKIVGQELKVKIIDLNPRNNKLIISERAAGEEDIKKLLEGYKTDDIIDGIVSGVANFGAFVRFADNPSIEGFIHISELDYKMIDNPKDIVKINEQIKVKILEIKNSSVNLSLKALKTDPWLSVDETYKVGQKIKGKIIKIRNNGAFIQLTNDIIGLLPISEFSGQNPADTIQVGQDYTFSIVNIDAKDHKLILTLEK